MTDPVLPLRQEIRPSIWERVTDTTVLVAFLAGASGVAVAWLTSHSFVGKTMCRIKTEQMTPLAVGYGNFFGAYLDYIIALEGKADAARKRFTIFERAIIDNATDLQDKLRPGKTITEDDIRKMGQVKTEDDVDEEDLSKNVKKANKAMDEEDTAFRRAVHDLIALCP